MMTLPRETLCSVLATVGLLLIPGSLPAASKRLVAVFAHPDDEISVGPVLSRYADEGHDVQLVSITSGQVGVSNTDIPAGDALGAAREQELACSAAKLGIKPPHFLRFMDGGTAVKGTLVQIRTRLRELLHELAPDVLLTWGPDGLSGHLDHRVASLLTTEIFQEPWPPGKEPPRKLYYVALPASKASEGRQFFIEASLVDDDLITTVVDGAAYMDRLLAAMKCHVTQWAPESRIEAMFNERRRILGGAVSLRLAMSRGVAAAPGADVLAGLDAGNDARPLHR
jgi:LmbE family N-acetylglucosaminyl deacetylase